MDERHLIDARANLLATAQDYFIREPGVVGLFLGGSLPAGTADAWSDIDLRVVVEAERHKSFVERRLEIPQGWDGFLFNEWLEGALHCVSHFRPFLKIDIFYLDQSTFRPSPWLAQPIAILHDRDGYLADIIGSSQGLAFATDPADIDQSLGKGLAAAHETYRRIRRNDLIYAQSLLDELRFHMGRADDWICRRPPQAVVLSRMDGRAGDAVLRAFSASYPPLERHAIEVSLGTLLQTYRQQIVELHALFRPSRSLPHDLEAADLILREVPPPTSQRVTAM